MRKIARRRGWPRGCDRFAVSAGLRGCYLVPARRTLLHPVLLYTRTLEPDVSLMGMSFPNEQDAALNAAAAIQPLTTEPMADERRRWAEELEQARGRAAP